MVFHWVSEAIYVCFGFVLLPTVIVLNKTWHSQSSRLPNLSLVMEHNLTQKNVREFECNCTFDNIQFSVITTLNHWSRSINYWVHQKSSLFDNIQLSNTIEHTWVEFHWGWLLNIQWTTPRIKLLHFVRKWKVKPKPIVSSFLHAFNHGWQQLHVFPVCWAVCVGYGRAVCVC